jgi:hypothetical protein
LRHSGLFGWIASNRHSTDLLSHAHFLDALDDDAVSATILRYGLFAQFLLLVTLNCQIPTEFACPFLSISFVAQWKTEHPPDHLHFHSNQPLFARPQTCSLPEEGGIVPPQGSNCLSMLAVLFA